MTTETLAINHARWWYALWMWARWRWILPSPTGS